MASPSIEELIEFLVVSEDTQKAIESLRCQRLSEGTIDYICREAVKEIEHRHFIATH